MQNHEAIYKHIKLHDEFFKSNNFLFFTTLELGADYLVVFLRLIFVTFDRGGELTYKLGDTTEEIDSVFLKSVFGVSDEVAENALELLLEYEFLEVNDRGLLQVKNYANYIGTETYYARIKRLQRKDQKPTKGYENIKIVGKNRVLLPNGRYKVANIDKYGERVFEILDRSVGRCEVCGSYQKVRIRHRDGDDTNCDFDNLIMACGDCDRGGKL